MIRFASLFLLSTLISISATAQIFQPVQWNFSHKDLGNNEYQLDYSATIEPGWHVYSQDLPSEDGPVATKFSYTPDAGYELVGKTEEIGDMHHEYDPNFEMDLNYYEGSVTFRQKVRVLKDGDVVVKGEFEWMVCNEERCLPPEYPEFEFKLSGNQETGAIESIQPEDDALKSNEAAGSDVAIDLNGIGGGDMGGLANPTTWSFDGKVLEGNTYELEFTAKVDGGWHIYSQKSESDDGPVPTSFQFETLENSDLIGETTEHGDLHSVYEEVFDCNVNYYDKSVTFKQQVSLKGESGLVKGFLTYMVCEDGRCLAPTDVEFGFNLKDGQVIWFDPTSAEEASTAATLPSDFADGCYRPIIETVDLENPIIDCGEKRNVETNLLQLFLLGFVGGLLALLTPCVFPMIPLTVSFFTKGSENKRKGMMRAILYGFFIFLVYILLSIPFHLLDQVAPDILNNISTNTWLNVGFFVVFIVFAISFFGYFELTLPSSWTTKTDNKSEAGGILGIFFMALTLALVSFSCTGPILGSLLAGSLSSTGGAWQLTSGMAGFGLALALPFALFAMFPGWLNSLPRSGGWLTTVKVVLGFLEIALALKFFSNADLVEQWGLLKREVFFGLWLVTAIGLGLYLLGKIRFAHDPPKPNLTKTRIGLGIASFAFAIYLLPGTIHQNWWRYDLLAGLPPPTYYSLFEAEHEIEVFTDYCEAVEYAQQVGKPIMVDFTGWACVNCRKMEENVWTLPNIKKKLIEDYVVVSLYVDERTRLPEDLQRVVETKATGKRKLKTVGDKWAIMQTETFLINSQPWYALLSPDEVLLNNPVGYTPDDETYEEWLDCGLNANQQVNAVSQHIPNGNPE